MSVGINNTNYPYTNAATNYSSKATEQEKVEKAETEKTAAAEAGATQKTETYKPDMDKINTMKAELKNNTLAFKQMVYSMFKQQGGFATDAMKSLLEIDKDIQLSAQEAISEDGYWGVNQTADRILEFAKALSGGDPSAIPGLKEAVQAGFDAAEKIWGGKLPDICYQTRQKVMDGFDEWENPGEKTEKA